jgi:hypothetical protein
MPSFSKQRRKCMNSHYKVLTKKDAKYLYPWSGPIPYFSSKGSSFQIGRRHGIVCKDQVRRNLLGTTKILKEELHIGDSLLAEDLDVYDEKIRKCHPTFSDEIRGIAEGAGVKYSDVLMLNSFMNLRTLHDKQEIQLSRLCSSFAAWGPATKDGNPIVGHNDDGVRFSDQFLALMDAQPSEGFRFCLPIYPGYLGYHTIVNDQGFSAVGTGLEQGPKREYARMGVPIFVLFRYLGQFVDNVESGIEFLKRADNGISGNFLLTDKTGAAAIIHLVPDDLAVIRPGRRGDDYFVLTNHALTDSVKERLTLRKYPETSHFRYQSVLRSVKKERGRIDLDRAVAIMSTHYDYSAGKDNHPSGNTPCRHYEYEGKFAGTCRSAVISLSKRAATMRVGLGNPCTATWTEVKLPINS